MKAKPAGVAHFLVRSPLFCRDLNRAEKQLDVVGHQSLEMQAGAGIYRRALERRGSVPGSARFQRAHGFAINRARKMPRASEFLTSVVRWQVMDEETVICL